MRVSLLDDSSFPEWDAYVAARPAATCYHHRAWKQVAENAYGMRTSFLLARDGGGAVRGVLPLFVVRRPFGKLVTTGLFGAYGPLLADDDAALAALIEEACVVTARAGASLLQIKALGDFPAPPGFERMDTSVTSIAALEPSAEAMWKRLDGEIRTAVRKARKQGLEVRSGREQVEPFYDVLGETMHRKGSPIYGLGFVRELLAAFGDDAEVITLWSKGAAVSGALVIWFKGTVYVPFVSSRAAAFPMRPNELLYWEIIERACKRNVRALDFGRSPKGATLRFKQKWGSEVIPVPFYVRSTGRQGATLDANKGGVASLVRLWQKMPRSWAEAIGPRAARWIG
jgi:serine/alanine adding enzyme